MRPRLRTFITDVYRDVSYALDDQADATAEYQNFVRKRFIKGWENLIEGYKVLQFVLILVGIYLENVNN